MLSSHGRRESMFMDMDVLVESEPATRVPSPSPAANGEVASKESAIVEEEEPRKKAGNLMREIKQDVQQGAAEFNMDNFS